MSDKRGTLREISWADLCPWFLLFRTFRLAVGLPLLLLGTFAAVLIPVGWRGAEFVFLGDTAAQNQSELRDWIQYRRLWPGQQFELLTNNATGESTVEMIAETARAGAVTPLYREGIEPFVRLLGSRKFELREWAYLLAGTVWTLVVWGWLGGAINRVAVVRLGCEQGVGVGEALRFSRQRLRSYVVAPLLPLVGVALSVLPCALLGLAMRSDWGLTLSAVAWGLLLLMGLVIVLLLLCVGLGWPLMWGAISAEALGDEFEAINRSFSFALGRPWHYLFYVLVVAIVGTAGTIVVDTFARSTIATARWSAAWGTGSERWEEIQRVEEASELGEDLSDEQQATLTGLKIVYFWEACARSIAVGFRHSFFWVAAAGIYLLLRRQVDETELDEVYLEALEPVPPLPDLEFSAPVAGDKSPASAATVGSTSSEQGNSAAESSELPASPPAPPNASDGSG